MRKIDFWGGSAIDIAKSAEAFPAACSHLTKYSNISNIQTGQKKLVVDKA